VISATHRNLPEEIRGGKFREDLFYRLRVVTIELPPLRAHKEDIPALAEAFLQMHTTKLRSNKSSNSPIASGLQLSREALTALERYDWPGNVRELKNALERAVVLSRGDELTLADLPEEVVTGQGLTRTPSTTSASNGTDLSEKDFREAKRKFEVAYLLKQLGDHHWNVSRTAATIGLHRQSLQEKLRELNIRRPGRDSPDDDSSAE
jgi:DNA-binding NtrC family response regulator